MATDVAGTRPSGLGPALAQAFTRMFKARPGSAAHRATVLGDSLGLFESCAVRRAPDGYPRVTGTIRGREIKLAFIPDSLAIKRLPQLWLSMTLHHDCACAPLTLTARPRGDDYVSMGTSAGISHLVPDWLPRDFAVRGCDDAPERLEQLRRPLEQAFHDLNIKEIAFVPQRIHLLYRMSEGRRGMHLLFRELVFDDELTRETLSRLVGVITRLASDITETAPRARNGSANTAMPKCHSSQWPA